MMVNCMCLLGWATVPRYWDVAVKVFVCVRLTSDSVGFVKQITPPWCGWALPSGLKAWVEQRVTSPQGKRKQAHRQPLGLELQLVPGSTACQSTLWTFYWSASMIAWASSTLLPNVSLRRVSLGAEWGALSPGHLRRQVKRPASVPLSCFAEQQALFMITRNQLRGRRHHGISPICLNNEVLPIACRADYERSMYSMLYPPFGEKEKNHIWIFYERSHESVCCAHGLLPCPEALLITESYVLPVLCYCCCGSLDIKFPGFYFLEFSFVTGFSTSALFTFGAR